MRAIPTTYDSGGKAYEEALRRIRVAEETGAVELDLSGWKERADTNFED